MRAGIIACFAFLPLCALAQRITPTLDLAAVRVEITWAESQGEINRLSVEHGQRPAVEGPRPKTLLTGFALLVRREGELVCKLFLKKPQRVDDERTLQLGHELAHCLLGQYHP